MLAFLSKPRSSSYHRRTLLKFIVFAGLLYLLWEPIRPVRVVTADALVFTAQQIRR
tara:strand:- start:905 stop:1072 length:168 start_codon:yes stop_codon:yes gene_type:complete